MSISGYVRRVVTPDAPKKDDKVEDLLGQPSGKFDYKVFYSKPPSYNIPIESIIPRIRKRRKLKILNNHKRRRKKRLYLLMVLNC